MRLFIAHQDKLKFTANWLSQPQGHFTFPPSSSASAPATSLAAVALWPQHEAPARSFEIQHLNIPQKAVTPVDHG